MSDREPADLSFEAFVQDLEAVVDTQGLRRFALVGTVSPTSDDTRLATYVPSLTALMSRCAGIRMPGSSALALAHVAAGRLDGFWMATLRPWDIAAGALLVKEAGGRIGDLAGGSQYLRTSEVIAASPGVFNAIRETVAEGRAA